MILEINWPKHYSFSNFCTQNKLYKIAEGSKIYQVGYFLLNLRIELNPIIVQLFFSNPGIKNPGEVLKKDPYRHLASKHVVAGENLSYDMFTKESNCS